MHIHVCMYFFNCCAFTSKAVFVSKPLQAEWPIRSLLAASNILVSRHQLLADAYQFNILEHERNVHARAHHIHAHKKYVYRFVRHTARHIVQKFSAKCSAGLDVSAAPVSISNMINCKSANQNMCIFIVDIKYAGHSSNQTTMR